MAVGAKLYTAYDGPATLLSEKMALPPGADAYGGLTGLQVRGPANAATVVKVGALLRLGLVRCATIAHQQRLWPECGCQLTCHTQRVSMG